MYIYTLSNNSNDRRTKLTLYLKLIPIVQKIIFVKFILSKFYKGNFYTSYSQSKRFFFKFVKD